MIIYQLEVMLNISRYIGIAQLGDACVNSRVVGRLTLRNSVESVTFAFGVRKMKFRNFAVNVSLIAASMMPLGAAQATVLLSLTNAASQTNTPYALTFTASGAETTIAISGYQPLAWEFSKDNGLFLDGSGNNLLGADWTLTKAANGSDAFEIGDGSSVPALQFGGLTKGSYDTFSQTIATQAGNSYTLDLLYTNYSPSSPSSFIVSEVNGGLSALGTIGSSTGNSPVIVSDAGNAISLPGAVPEPSTWALMLLGFVGVGLGGYKSKARGLAQAA